MRKSHVYVVLVSVVAVAMHVAQVLAHVTASPYGG
jgi:hypothetical protein